MIVMDGDAPVALPRLGDDLLRRRFLCGDRPAVARIRRRPRAQQGAGGNPLGLLRCRHPGCLAAGRLRRQPCRPAADGDLRPAPARLRERRLRFRRGDLPARRRPLRAGGRRRPDLVGRADLVDHRRPRGPARLGDRHRPRHRRRGRTAGAGAGRDRRFGRHRAGLQLGHGHHRGARRSPPRGCPRPTRPRRQSTPRGGGGDAQPARGRGGDLRRRALGDVRRDRGAGAAADRRARRRPRRDRRRLHRRSRDGGRAGAGGRADLRPGRPPHAVRQSG